MEGFVNFNKKLLLIVGLQSVVPLCNGSFQSIVKSVDKAVADIKQKELPSSLKTAIHEMSVQDHAKNAEQVALQSIDHVLMMQKHADDAVDLATHAQMVAARLGDPTVEKVAEHARDHAFNARLGVEDAQNKAASTVKLADTAEQIHQKVKDARDESSYHKAVDTVKNYKPNQNGWLNKTVNDAVKTIQGYAQTNIQDAMLAVAKARSALDNLPQDTAEIKALDTALQTAFNALVASVSIK